MLIIFGMLIIQFFLKSDARFTAVTQEVAHYEVMALIIYITCIMVGLMGLFNVFWHKKFKFVYIIIFRAITFLVWWIYALMSPYFFVQGAPLSEMILVWMIAIISFKEMVTRGLIEKEAIDYDGFY